MRESEREWEIVCMCTVIVIFDKLFLYLRRHFRNWKLEREEAIFFSVMIMQSK